MQDDRWGRLIVEARANQARVLAEPGPRVPWLALLALSPLFLVVALMYSEVHVLRAVADVLLAVHRTVDTVL